MELVVRNVLLVSYAPTANVCLTVPQDRPLAMAPVWIPSLILPTVAPAVPPVPVEKSVPVVSVLVNQALPIAAESVEI